MWHYRSDISVRRSRRMEYIRQDGERWSERKDSFACLRELRTYYQISLT